MKKLLPIVIIGLIAIPAVFLSFPSKTSSKTQLTYSNVGASCTQAWENGADALEEGWYSSLQNMVNQEKPTSQVVDDAYESLRTYRCWLQDLCKSVQWSGNQTVRNILQQKQNTAKTLGSFALGNIPGCVDAEDVELPSTWADFQESISKNPFYNPPAEPGKFNMIPQCINSSQTKTIDDFISGVAEYQACKKYTEDSFSNRGVNILEDTLFTAAAEKKASAVESKIIDITKRLQGSQANAQLFKQDFIEFMNRLPCVLKSCT